MDNKKFRLSKQQKIRMTRYITIFSVAFSVFMIFTMTDLYRSRKDEDTYWVNSIRSTDEVRTAAEKTAVDATEVTVGTYVVNLDDLSLDDSDFGVTMEIWFKWKGDPDLDMKDNFRIYKADINSRQVLKDYSKGGENYQLIRADCTIAKNYYTQRFPLESHQLRIFVESDYPSDRVKFVDDREHSGVNSGLSIAGFYVRRADTGIYIMKYDNAHGDPEYADGPMYNYEHVTELEINRSGFGLYVLCFIALYGTLVWSLISLFIGTYHEVDPLSLIPSAFFGTVANIMVGAGKVATLSRGLLLYMNVFGIAMILAIAVHVIVMNRIRNIDRSPEYAAVFGRVVFWLTLLFTLAGNIILPVISYMK